MYAIVTVEKLEDSLKQKVKWPDFQSEMAKHEPLMGTPLRPSENVWCLPLPAGTGTLATVVQAAQSFELAHRVLYFEKPPQEFRSAPNR